MRKLRVQYWLMLTPMLLLAFGITIPFLKGVYTSFTNEKAYIRNPTFSGLDNFIALASEETFRTGFAATFIYVLLVLAVQIPLAIGVALLLDKTSILQWLARRILVAPLLIPPIVTGLMWKTMMQPSAGVLNYLLSFIGVNQQPWLTDTATSLVSAVIIDTWAFTSFSALLLLAGLQSLPIELREAAAVDGADGVKFFRRITLPWLAPYIVLACMFRVADSLKQFDLIWPVTRGGPIDSTRLLHVQGYEEAFRFASPGRAMAIVFVLWIIVYGSSFLLLKLWRRTVNAVT